MNKNSCKPILFTGAGFTNNFGGFLAREMWSKIFNNPEIQSNKTLKELLLNNFNYEFIYFAVLRSCKQKERELIKRVILKAYEDLDNIICNWNFNNSNPDSLNIYGFRDLLVQFIGSGHERGYFFTLNQDLLMERFNGYRSVGAPVFNNNFYSWQKAKLKYTQFIRLPGENAMINTKATLESAGNFVYIKLHGSYGWLSSNGADNQMVIGYDKLNDINKEPLLKWYLELFEKVIKEGAKKLVIIGYGFGDEHINDILLEGVNNYELRPYIISPTDPEMFMKRLREKKLDEIWKNLGGYFPCTLKQMFPHSQDQHPTPLYHEFKNAISY
jgi:hypothetical protein